MTLCALVVATVMIGAGCGVCANEDEVRVPSPDGVHVAHAFVRNCGATTDYVTVVELESGRWWRTGSVPLTSTDGCAVPPPEVSQAAGVSIIVRRRALSSEGSRAQGGVRRYPVGVSAHRL